MINAADIDVIQRMPLHLQLVGRLRNLIISGELAPGAKIREHVLCDRFGVSRTPLREALKVLASEGVIVLRPNRGAAVADYDREELAEAFQVIGALERLAGELAARNITGAEIAAIERLHLKLVGHHDAKRLGPYFEINREIHLAIVRAARNEVLEEHYRQLSVRLMSARYVAKMSPERWRQAVSDHERILAALKARDGAALADTLATHLAHKFETVSDWISSPPG